MREIYQHSPKWHFQIDSAGSGKPEKITPTYSQQMDHDLGRLLWLPRKILIFPMVFIHIVTGVDVHFTYSLEIFFLLLVTSFLLAKVITVYSGVLFERAIPHIVSVHVSLIFFLSLSLAMNGRMVFAFLAITVLMYIHAAHYIERSMKPNSIFSFLFLMFLCAGSSTGVYSVTYASSVILFLGGSPWPFQNSKGRFILFFMFFAAAAWFFLGLYKNLLYFGGETTRIFMHGFGSQLPQFGSWAPVFLWGFLFGITATGCWALFEFSRRLGSFRNLILNPYAALGILTLVGFVGGLFGYSTLTTAIPPLFTATLLTLIKIASCFRKRSRRPA